jgi:hypothetical protein
MKSKSNIISNTNCNWLLKTLKKHCKFSSNKAVIRAALETLYQKVQSEESKNWNPEAETPDKFTWSRVE